jgi:hypothetical protein
LSDVATYCIHLFLLEADMLGHVNVQTRTDDDRQFEVLEAGWVEIHLRHTGRGTARSDELRLRLDTSAVTEIVGAVMRFASDADLGVIE